jgi:hypothetical protein
VIVALTATITTPTREASAVVAADPCSAGCARYRGAVAVRRPVGACRFVAVCGVRVRHSV